MKKQLLLMICAFTTALLVPVSAQAQKMMRFDANTSFLFEEFQTMLQEEDGSVIVRVRLGAPSETLGDQLQKDDLIIMMNGERINGVADIRNIYENLDDGEEIKVGVRRGDERFIVSTVKGDIPEGNGNVRTVVRTEKSGGEAPPIIPELGLVLSNKDGQVVIENLLDPILPEELSNLQLKKGDKLLRIGDSTLTDADEAVNLIDEVPEGDKLTLLFEQDGKELSVTLEKPAPPTNVNINIEQ